MTALYFSTDLGCSPSRRSRVSRCISERPDYDYLGERDASESRELVGHILYLIHRARLYASTANLGVLGDFLIGLGWQLHLAHSDTLYNPGRAYGIITIYKRTWWRPCLVLKRTGKGRDSICGLKTALSMWRLISWMFYFRCIYSPESFIRNSSCPRSGFLRPIAYIETVQLMNIT